METTRFVICILVGLAGFTNGLSDDCVSDPCQNDGICENTIEKYHCYCKPKYYGNNCEFYNKKCDGKTPCLHGSTCHTVDSTYVCICPLGVSGQNCEDDYCLFNEPCQNGGTCYSLPNDGYDCHCPSGHDGFHGPNCIIPFNYYCRAINNPCQNGGTCHSNLNGDTYCNCPVGYDGPNCEFPLNH